MPLPSTNRRKSSDVTSFDKNKFTTKSNEMKSGIHDKSETHEHMDLVKKSDIPNFTNYHRKSDAEKSLHNDTQEKVSGEPYVHESKEFAGVTIIFRTATNSKAFAHYDAHGKTGGRRKSEFQQSQLNMQDKFEHGDKTDHIGTGYSMLAAKTDTSTNNYNDTSRNDSQH